MVQIKAKGQRWFKFVHAFFVCMWVGACVCLNLLLFFMRPENGMQLYGINATMKFIDDFIIVPGAVGCLLTGILYSVFTHWGWFKHRWITMKWLITVYGILFGTFYLGPRLDSLAPISKAEGLKALANPIYIDNMTMLKYWGTFQLLTIICAVFISIFKPWKRERETARAPKGV